MAGEPATELLTGVEVDRRSARKDGREVVTLRCVDTGANGFVVECDVYPVDAVRVEPAHQPTEATPIQDRSGSVGWTTSSKRVPSCSRTAAKRRTSRVAMRRMSTLSASATIEASTRPRERSE